MNLVILLDFAQNHAGGILVILAIVAVWDLHRAVNKYISNIRFNRIMAKMGSGMKYHNTSSMGLGNLSPQRRLVRDARFQGLSSGRNDLSGVGFGDQFTMRSTRTSDYPS